MKRSNDMRKKRDYETNEINEITEKFGYFVYFVCFVIPLHNSVGSKIQ